MKIKSREELGLTLEQYRVVRDDVKEMLIDQWIVEREALIEHLDSFLELRIEAEFEELKEDLADSITLHNLIEALTEENMAFRDQITALSIENLHLTMDNLSWKDKRQAFLESCSSAEVTWPAMPE